MKIFIRTDASDVIGSGHVMRCLTIADELQGRGDDVQFVCRNIKGHMRSLIQKRGYNVLMLSNENKNISTIENITKKEKKIAVHQIVDAEETIEVINNTQADWFIVDHYSLGDIWHKYLYSYCKKIMVIDDLADRSFECDLLLDQTFGRETSEYEKFVPSKCVILTGAQYALLRPKFSELRARAENKRKKSLSVNRVLVSMGGVDSENIIPIILDGLETVNWENDVEIDVVLGMNAPQMELIKTKAKSLDIRVNVLSEVDNMAQLMLEADLAVGAGGTTSWERCCMGLPSLVVIYADNQTKIVKNLFNEGVVVDLGWSNKISSAKISMAIEKLMSSKTVIEEMSAKGFNVCNGMGVKQVAEYIV